MAFINEFASQDDINKFKLDELLNNYLNATSSYKHHWTIDKETGNWLISIKRLNSSESLWIFHYKDINIEVELFKTKQGNHDLISITPNSLNNQEIIHFLREALKILDTKDVVYSQAAKETSPQENQKEAQLDVKQISKKKINYLDILVFIIVLIIFFFIANDSNKTSKKTQTTKPLYDIYSVVQTSNDENGIFGINKEDLNTRTKILSFRTELSTCKVDKYGNIYWRDWTNKAIYKANPDGTNMRNIATADNGLGGIAIDNKNERIFWIRRLTDKKYSEIVYTDFSGENEHIVVSNKSISTTTRGIFYDYIYEKLYFTDWSSKELMVIDLKTKEIKKLAYSSSSQDIVLDYKNRRVIWTNTESDNISSSNFDGSDRKVLIQFDNTLSNPSGITIDTINERLIYGYYDSINNKDILETSKLDGSEKKVEKESVFEPTKSLFFTRNLSYKNGDM